MNGTRIDHPFGPLYGENSRILILGSFPSVKSREQNFFYGHPQNRFWKVIAALYGQETPVTVPEKRELILNNGLALWDSIASCVICNGRKSHEMYQKYIQNEIGREAICLPSTSPANAQFSLEKLIEAWSEITGSYPIA